MEWLFDPQILIAFLTLTVLELVLGIDNIIFISILSGKLPQEQRARGRFVGLSIALILRVLLLLSLTWIMGLEKPIFTILGIGISGRDIILLAGGLFLIAKSTHEIHGSLEGAEGEMSVKKSSSFFSVIIQISLIDIVFSLDSVITAIGMANSIWVMIAAIVVAVIGMMFFAGPISAFVEDHPTIKMLALSFLLLIGFTLVTEGLHQHIAKGYIYFAMAFSVFVEMLNIRLRKKGQPVDLHEPYPEETPS